jgi:hypothetical protein
VRIGQETEVQDEEMGLLAEKCPNLSVIGVPCPILTTAAKNGRLSRDDVLDLEDQPVRTDLCTCSSIMANLNAGMPCSQQRV